MKTTRKTSNFEIPSDTVSARYSENDDHLESKEKETQLLSSPKSSHIEIFLGLRSALYCSYNKNKIKGIGPKILHRTE